jgi:transcriptional regulator GlxA family with amidase domain
MDVFKFTGVGWNHLHDMEPTPCFEFQAVSLDGKPVSCYNGLSIGVNGSIHDVKQADLIVISATMDIEDTLRKHKAVIPWLIEQYEQGTQIAAVCMGTFVLAATGLLDGKVATTHWGVADYFNQLYPDVHLKPERLVTDANDLYCSGAYNASIDLSIYLVEKFYGQEIALQTAKVLVHDIGRSSQAPYTTFKFQRSHNDETILATQRIMEENFLQHMDVEKMASDLGLGRRTFERRFKAATGDTPLFYFQRVRVEKAKKILETERKTLDEISFAVGYEDASFFKKVFIKHTGLKPTEYRSKFQRTVDFNF